MDQVTKEQILSFINSQKHAVISTCDLENNPEAALIGFGETDDFELIMGTYNTSRKYKNMKVNPKVAFVIGWEENSITVQFEGVARELEGDELEKYVSIYHKKVPGAAQFKSLPHQAYFVITPKWVRYSDLSEKTEKIVEFSF